MGNPNEIYWKNKTVLVTGGAGAIGSNLTKKLADLGAIVIILDDLSSSKMNNIDGLDGKITFIKGSITDNNALEKAFSHKPEIVFHLAALFANQNSIEHPEKDLEVNGLGTLKLLEYSRKVNVERFLFESSSCVYGDAAYSAEDDKNLNPETPYAITKLLGEQYTKFYHDYYGLKTVTFRVFNSFGLGELPGRYRNVIPNFIAMAIKGEPLTVYGSGEETRDFNWVGNLVDAMLAAVLEEKALGETFNIGSGKETRIIEIAQLINKITGSKAGIQHLPARSWDKVRRRRANIEKARKILGYCPENANLEEQLRTTYLWIKDHMN